MAKRITVQGALAEYQFVIAELSEKTQVGYLAKLQHFADWCSRKTAEKRLYISDIKPANVSAYLLHLRTSPTKTGKPRSSYTLHSYMRSIRTFLYWCARPPQRYLSIEVPQNLVMPKIDIKVIEPFSKQQLDAMHIAINQNAAVFPIIGARNRAILDLLVDTGIRASELCGLRLSDIHFSSERNNSYIKVFGKGRKEREVPLGAKARKSLNEYIKNYRPHVPNEDHVFLGHRSEPVTVSALDQSFRRIGKRAHVVGVRCSPHTCRDTYAINFLLQGGDVYVLSRLLGHESIQVTEGYLRAVKGIQARQTGKSVLDNL